jgi:hypothetical protein
VATSADENLKGSSSMIARLGDKHVFPAFAASVRKNQAFLRKATDDELWGIYERLTPTEKQLYSEMIEPSKKTKKDRTATKEKKERKEKKVKSKPSKETPPKPLDDFINDEPEESEYETGSEDISLVSESELDEPKEPVVKVKKDKKKSKRQKTEATDTLPHTAKPSTPLKKFTWS